MNNIILFVLGSAAIAIIYGIIYINVILKLPEGNDKMKQIARAIQEGAKAYLNRQYKTVAMAAIILFLIIS
jgi:K(+)-stimulated pyrophosphate-energized sodium pump